MDNKAMYKISYGLFVLTANDGTKDNGCIINTVTQVTVDPNQITIAVNKMNYTHDIIAVSKQFAVSAISEAADFELFKHFGFLSGKNVNKFETFDAVKRVCNGTLAVTKGTNSYISAEVTQQLDLGTHTLFLAKVLDAEVFNETESATYNYYQQHIKPKPQPVGQTKDGKTIWRCTICGYEYVGDELPADFNCPICKHPASDFEKVTD
ncbi:MAG: flavin reductase [Selenomonadaceae bacterium]|nr:flavin reductase [Selenomonadaceae bacterium]